MYRERVNNMIDNDKYVKWEISILLVLVMIIIGKLGYDYYQEEKKLTPEYALLQLQKAVEKHDYMEMKEYVDTEQVIYNLYNDNINVKENRVAKDQYEKEWYKKEISELEKDRIFNINAMFKIARAAFWEEVPDGLYDSNICRRAKDIRKLSESYKGKIVSVRRDENTAIATIEFDAVNNEIYPQNEIVELSMKQMANGKWKITKIENLKKLITKYW